MKKTAIKAAIKGVVHATIVPIVIMMLVNRADGNYGLIAGLCYLVVPATVYYHSATKDISKKVFFFMLKIIMAFAWIYFLMLLSAFL